MNIRHIIRNAIDTCISIDEETIEGAVRAALENLDIPEKIQNAIETLLPDAVTELMEEVVDEIIADEVTDAVDETINDLKRSL